MMACLYSRCSSKHSFSKKYIYDILHEYKYSFSMQKTMKKYIYEILYFSNIDFFENIVNECLICKMHVENQYFSTILFIKI